MVNCHFNLRYFSPDSYSRCQRQKLLISAGLATLENMYFLLPVKPRVLPEGTAVLEGKAIYNIFWYVMICWSWGNPSIQERLKLETWVEALQPTDISKSKRHPEEVSLERGFLMLFSFPAINSVMCFTVPFMHQKCNHLSEMKAI